MLPHLRRFPRPSRPVLAAGLPAIAAAAALAWPCACPDHQHGSHAAHAHAPAHGAGRVVPVEHHEPSAAAPTAAARTIHHGESAFEVGTPDRPIVARGPRGPLWKPTPPSAPGRASHGTFAELTVAAELAALRAEKAGEPDDEAGLASDVVATRAAMLTTAQATKKLSKKCQKLVKANKRKLRKADRRRRSTCLAQRRKLVAASRPTAPTTPASTAPAPPAAPIEGPKPTTAPPTTPSPPVAPTTPAATTPTPEKKYGAVGIHPTDSDPVRWILSRPSTIADIVNVELDNTDRQVHDLWIAPGNADGEITDESAKQRLIGFLEPGERKAVDVALKPGIYIFICNIAGHETMKVKFTVFAP